MLDFISDSPDGEEFIKSYTRPNFEENLGGLRTCNSLCS